MVLSMDVTHTDPVTSSGLLASESLGTCPQIYTCERHDNRNISWGTFAGARIAFGNNL